MRDVYLHALEGYFIAGSVILMAAVCFLTSEIHHAKKEILKRLDERERGE